LEGINATNEIALLPDLQWLYLDCAKKTPENFRFYSASMLSKMYLSALYAKQGNLVMAELFNSKSGFYINLAQLNAMKLFLSKSNKTAFEQLATSIYGYNLNDINAYQAVEATFQNQIPQAIAFMKQSNYAKEKLYGNPFKGGIQDCHDCDHAEPQKTLYSPLQLLVIIKEKQNNLAVNKEIFSNAVLLGNAFYNITYFGNARHFYEGKINGYGLETYSRTDCSIAKMYYQKALAAAKTDEQKAQCYYLLAKCERNEYYINKYKNNEYYWYWGNDEDKINFLAWNGFKELKNNYSNTKFYQEVLQECGYFKTYVEEGK
jgi:hypothetical protein